MVPVPPALGCPGGAATGGARCAGSARCRLAAVLPAARCPACASGRTWSGTPAAPRSPPRWSAADRLLRGRPVRLPGQRGPGRQRCVSAGGACPCGPHDPRSAPARLSSPPPPPPHAPPTPGGRGRLDRGEGWPGWKNPASLAAGPGRTATRVPGREPRPGHVAGRRLCPGSRMAATGADLPPPSPGAGSRAGGQVRLACHPGPAVSTPDSARGVKSGGPPGRPAPARCRA